MALLWMDGFDMYGNTDDAAVSPIGVMRARYHQAQERVYTYTGRFDGFCIVSYWDNVAWVQTPALTIDDTLIVGFSMFCPDPHNTGEIFQLRSANNNAGETIGGISLTLNADRSLTIKRESTTLGSTSAAVVPLDDWCYLELKIVCDNTTGIYELHIDGVNELSNTGVDTQSDSDAFYDVVRFNGALASTTPLKGVRIDDLWVCDSTSGYVNNFLGAGIRIATISPEGDGDSTNWTPSAGGTNYNLVDEDVLVDTDYVENAIVDNLDLYEYEALPALSSLKAVQVITEVKSTEPNEWVLKTVVKHNTTEDADAGQTVASSEWTGIRRLMVTNPLTTNTWEVSDVDNLQVGLKVG